MGLLEQLGLGGIFGSRLPDYWQLREQEAVLQQHYAQHIAYLQQQNLISRCIHSNCPICLKQNEETQKAKIEQDKVIVEKKLAYENRCEDYMKKFRRNIWITAHQQI